MRQRRWLELVKDYDCTIQYHPGKANVVADALSRKVRGELVCSITQQRQLIHEFARMQLEVVESPPKLPVVRGIRAMRVWPTLQDKIRRDQAFDDFVRTIGAKIHAGGVEGLYRGTAGTFEYKGRIVVPNVEAMKKELLTEAHSTPYLAHPGSTKMYHELKRSFCWRGMKRDVADFVEKCLVCQQVKAEHKCPIGLLQPLEIPSWKWEEVTMDFVTGLPKSSEHHDAIWVVVDRLTKVAHFMPVSMTMSMDQFWESLHEAMDTQLKFSSAYHPETDGQSEKMIQTLEDMHRALILDRGAKWEKWLLLVKFAYNNSYQASIQMAPYEALYGRKCRSPLYWDDVGERRVLGPKLIEETVKQVLPMRGVVRFGKRGKLHPRYIGPFEVLERVGEVAYRVARPPKLASVHNVFHISMLRPYVCDPEHVLQHNEIQLQPDLTYEEQPVALLDRKVLRLRKRDIPLIRIRRNRHGDSDATWEREVDIRARFPDLDF
ncbi:polyprotein [Striga asiatica]|uniref:Polyprotein n=1 Tax=Striga asiatica TaxID=4170 RepID=A0A5A7R2A9_STRAF|nr:polyprotein [Striga asiatica]